MPVNSVALRKEIQSYDKDMFWLFLYSHPKNSDMKFLAFCIYTYCEKLMREQNHADIEYIITKLLHSHDVRAKETIVRCLVRMLRNTPNMFPQEWTGKLLLLIANISQNNEKFGEECLMIWKHTV